MGNSDSSATTVAFARDVGNFVPKAHRFNVFSTELRTGQEGKWFEINSRGYAVQ